MQLTGRLLIAFGLVTASQLVVIAIHAGTDPKYSPLPELSSTSLPEGIGDFEGHDAPLDKRMVAASDAEAMINRVYENRIGDNVVVNVGVWSDFGMGIPHPPEICYPAAGWEIARRNLLTIPVDGREKFTFKQIVFQRDANRIVVVSWVHLGDDVITDAEEIRPILQQLRGSGGNLPVLVKVMLQTDAQDVDQAQARLSRFVAALVPYTDTIQ